MASVLVVDDQADVVASLRLALEGRGHVVSVARSGAAALTAVRKQAPDLVVVAAEMAQQDGWAVLQQLKEDADASVRAVPVVLLTPMDAVDDQLRAGIEGAVACVDEPVDPSTFLAVVQAVLGGGAEADQRKAAQHRALTRLAQLEAGAGRVAAPAVRLIDLEGPRHRQKVDRRVAAPGSRPTSERDLTSRQRDILRAIARSVTVTEAAADLGVSRSSLYGGLRRIGRTLGVPDVRSLIRRARAGDLAASFER